MIKIDKDTTFYYLDTDPEVGFTLSEFMSLEVAAFERVGIDETPLFCKHKSSHLGDFFVSLN